MLRYLSTLFIGVVFFISSSALAQERQVAFDSAGKILTLDQDMRNKFGLFQADTNFLEATLYQKEDNTFTLEVVTEGKNGRSRRKETLGNTEVIALRERITETLRRSDNGYGLDQEGRSRFLTGMLTVALLLHGPAAVAIMEPSDGATGTGIYLAAAGAGYFLPSLLTSKANVSEGQASLGLTGAFLGYGHGALLTEAFRGSSSASYKTYLGVGLLMSVGETVLGYSIAGANHIPGGDADIISNAGVWGIAHGFGWGYVVGITDWQALAGISVATSFGGMYAASRFARNGDYSIGDASAMNIFAGMGAYIAGFNALGVDVLILNSANDVEPALKVTVAAALLGNLGGYAFGQSFLKGKDISKSDGTILSLSTAAGWLVGAGLGYIVISSDLNSSNTSRSSFLVWSLMSSAGMIGGFALAYNAISPKKAHSSSSTGWDVRLNPTGLLGALTNPQNNTPALNLSYRW